MFYLPQTVANVFFVELINSYKSQRMILLDVRYFPPSRSPNLFSSSRVAVIVVDVVVVIVDVVVPNLAFLGSR